MQVYDYLLCWVSLAGIQFSDRQYTVTKIPRFSILSQYSGHPTVTPGTPRNDGVVHVNHHDGTPRVACLQVFRQNTQKSECVYRDTLRTAVPTKLCGFRPLRHKYIFPAKLPARSCGHAENQKSDSDKMLGCLGFLGIHVPGGQYLQLRLRGILAIPTSRPRARAIKHFERPFKCTIKPAWDQQTNGPMK